MSRVAVSCAAAVCSVLLGSVGCKTAPNEAAPSASAAAAVPSGSATATAAPAKPWYSGEFAGEYDAKLAAVEVKVGALKEWGKDDGKLSAGPGKLSLKIDDAGRVSGTSEGALGTSQVDGKVEEDTLRVQLSPADDAGLHGVLVAARAGDGFKGTIQASSGDSLRVRTAAIELKKLAP